MKTYVIFMATLVTIITIVSVITVLNTVANITDVPMVAVFTRTHQKCLDLRTFPILFFFLFWQILCIVNGRESL